MGSPARLEQSAEILDAACARNLPLELHYRAAGDQIMVARTRILDMDDENIFLDRPQSSGGPFSPVRGQAVTADMRLNGRRLGFHAHVTRARCYVRLNDQTRVTGFSISRPTKVEEVQRREDFRLTVASINPIEVRLHEVTDADTTKCLLDAKRAEGSLVDISRGGVCVRVDARQRREFHTQERYFIDFVLPENAGEIVMLTELRHMQQILNGDATRIGLHFLPWAPQFTKPQVQRIARFCADLQRRIARRAR
ncbi:MAG: PilZ domain-containing protein [Phycisphaerae bacterium]